MAANEFDDDQTRSFTLLVAGTKVSHYTIISKIGAGGMGEVYLAEDSQLDRKVALKFLPPHLSQNKASRARFAREAKAAAKLDHPNIVPVYEVGEFQDRPYFAMAHIEGQSLKEVIREGKLTVPNAVEYTKQICEGLYKAHESNVVHRDIKPANIIIDNDNKPRILDFGLATVQGEEKLTQTGSTLGTVGYMSPEQITGKSVDHRSDLFSVGVILYEMLTGRRPFEGDNDVSILNAITSSTPEPVARFKSGVTGELQQIVNKALAKDSSVRYQHADGMLADLKGLSIESKSRVKRKLPLWIAVTIVALVLGFFGLSQILDERTFSSGPTRLAVLPFGNLGERDKDYFATGMTDEIINKLISIRDLKVITRQSAGRMKQEGMDVSQIGKELGVDYVLDASVHWLKSSNGAKRVKLVTRLIKVSDGSVHWGKSYDTTMTELFDIQADMATRISEQLGVVLTPQEKIIVAGRTTNSDEAWDYFVRGDSYYNEDPYSEKYLNLALEMYNKAIETDSGFAKAYTQKSRMYTRLYFYNINVTDSIKSLSWEMANKAIEVCSDRSSDHEGHMALANYYYRCERDYERALESLDKAYVGIGGKDNAGYHHFASTYLRRMGRWKEAYKHGAIAAEMEPKNFHLHNELGGTLILMRKYREAEKSFRKAIALKPDYFVPYEMLTEVSISWQADTERAREIIESSWHKIEDTARWGDFMITLNGMEGDFEAVRNHANSYSDKALLYDWQDITDSAVIYWDSALIENQEELKDKTLTPIQWGSLGKLYARMGNRKEAINHINKALELMPMSRDALDGTDHLIQLFYCYVFFGEFENANNQAEKILQVPAYFDIGQLLLDPDTRKFIKHPGFARLVSEYGNEYHKRLYIEKVGQL